MEDELKKVHCKSCHRIGNMNQAVMGYLELEMYDKAYSSAKLAASEMVRLAHALRNYRLTVPEGDGGAAVVVPHGSQVVSHDDVTVDVHPDEVRVIGSDEIRAGQGDYNPRTT